MPVSKTDCAIEPAEYLRNPCDFLFNEAVSNKGVMPWRAIRKTSQN